MRALKAKEENGCRYRSICCEVWGNENEQTIARLKKNQTEGSKNFFFK